jgi:branched-chain amino acid transport system substrate-binding protein
MQPARAPLPSLALRAVIPSLALRAGVLTLAVLTVAGCSRRAEEEPLLLGHLTSFSGSDRVAGEHARQGIVLALEDANKEDNRIAGRRVAVLHVDSRGDAERAAGEAVRLITVNKVLALLGGEPATVERLIATLPSTGPPLLTAVTLRPPAGQDGVFSVAAPPEFHGEVLARFASKVLKAERALLLVDDDRPTCVAVAGAFGKKWRSTDKSGLETISYENNIGDRLARRVREFKAQVVVLACDARAVAKVRPALDSVRVPLVFAGEAEEWARVLADPDARGIYGATPYATASKYLTDDGKQFLKRYREQYHEDPDLFAYQGNELVRVAVQALRETKGIGGTKLREVLAREEGFDGLTGKLVFKGGQVRRPLYVVRRVQGQGQGEEEQVEYKPE